MPSQQQESIAYKEFFPVALAASIWGYKWSRQHILFCSDNKAVVHILNSRTSKVPSIMRLMLSLLLSVARFNFSFSVQHIPGVLNEVTGALSRFNWQAFRRLTPTAGAATPSSFTFRLQPMH